MRAPRLWMGMAIYYRPSAGPDVEASNARVHKTGSRLGRRVTDGTSRRVHQGTWNKIEQGSDPVQERFHGAGTRQVEEDTVFVLLELGCDFEEREDQGGGLRVG